VVSAIDLGELRRVRERAPARLFALGFQLGASLARVLIRAPPGSETPLMARPGLGVAPVYLCGELEAAVLDVLLSLRKKKNLWARPERKSEGLTGVCLRRVTKVAAFGVGSTEQLVRPIGSPSTG